jgi:hypothetical protein
MARMKNVDGVNIPFTAEEETARDAEEAAWAAGETTRNAQAEINRLEGTVTPRRIREMTTDAGKDWVDAVEAAIAVERAKL